MGSRSTVLVGLAAGASAGVAILLAAVILLPDQASSPGATASSEASPAGSLPSGSRPAASPSLQASIGIVGFHIGEPAPALSIVQLGGGRIDLVNLKGRPIWINFMQTTCPACVDEFPLMNGFAVRYADAGLVVIAIDIREDEDTVASFVRALNVQFPIGLDTDGSAAQAWDAVASTHFWVDRDGIIRAGALGGIGPDVMAQSLGIILPGVLVTP